MCLAAVFLVHETFRAPCGRPGTKHAAALEAASPPAAVVRCPALPFPALQHLAGKMDRRSPVSIENFVAAGRQAAVPCYFYVVTCLGACALFSCHWNRLSAGAAACQTQWSGWLRGEPHKPASLHSASASASACAGPTARRRRCCAGSSTAWLGTTSCCARHRWGGCRVRVAGQGGVEAVV